MKNKIQLLEKQESEMMKKLQTTFQKVQDWASQSNTFDNFTSGMKNKVKYNRMHLKPISKNKKRSGGSRTHTNKYDGFIMNPKLDNSNHNIEQNGSIG